MRLFLDANILFTAAHNLGGKSALVLELGQAGIWQVVTSAYAAEEARRNLARKFPDFVARLEERLKTVRLVGAAPNQPCPQGLAEMDCPIYQAALACRADRLLTGDVRDFGLLMNDPDRAGGLLIQTVAEFLAGV